jgi:ribosomal protein S20
VAHSPRGWTGARTPSGKKRVRQAERRAAVNGPRASKAKTLVAKTLRIATGQVEGDATLTLAEAFSALDRAAKSGAIHPNAAARRKSRLATKVGAALGGAAVQAGAKATKTTGTAAAAKAAKARIAAGKAAKAKGAQTAAGKARAALAKAGRAEAEAVKAKAAAAPAEKPAPKPRATRAKAAAPAAKPATEAAAKKAPAKAAAAKPAAKAPAKKAPTKAAAPKAE